MSDKVLGQRIRAIRRARGFTLVQLAGATGMSRTTLSAIECGQRQLRISQLTAIVDALGADISGILTTSTLSA
jgi:transcriptional regulator with XRE-family HTH domain